MKIRVDINDTHLMALRDDARKNNMTVSQLLESFIDSKYSDRYLSSLKNNSIFAEISAEKFAEHVYQAIITSGNTEHIFKCMVNSVTMNECIAGMWDAIIVPHFNSQKIDIQSDIKRVSETELNLVSAGFYNILRAIGTSEVVELELSNSNKIALRIIE